MSYEKLCTKLAGKCLSFAHEIPHFLTCMIRVSLTFYSRYVIYHSTCAKHITTFTVLFPLLLLVSFTEFYYSLKINFIFLQWHVQGYSK
jgi:hypothetical protein